jgi:hypothetical protein
VKAGFEVATADKVSQAANIIVMLVPDNLQAFQEFAGPQSPAFPLRRVHKRRDNS